MGRLGRNSARFLADWRTGLACAELVGFDHEAHLSARMKHFSRQNNGDYFADQIKLSQHFHQKGVEFRRFLQHQKMARAVHA